MAHDGYILQTCQGGGVDGGYQSAKGKGKP
jgi:hypothetical protein